MAELRKGEHVSWKSHGGTAEGTVEKTITADTEAAGRGAQAVRADEGVTGAPSAAAAPRRARADGGCR